MMKIEIQNTQGIMKYNSDILPKLSGESIIVEDIGTASLGEEYDIELLLGNLYEITKK